jgi:hypothetical protein
MLGVIQGVDVSERTVRSVSRQTHIITGRSPSERHCEPGHLGIESASASPSGTPSTARAEKRSKHGNRQQRMDFAPPSNRVGVPNSDTGDKTIGALVVCSHGGDAGSLPLSSADEFGFHGLADTDFDVE